MEVSSQEMVVETIVLGSSFYYFSSVEMDFHLALIHVTIAIVATHATHVAKRTLWSFFVLFLQFFHIIMKKEYFYGI